MVRSPATELEFDKVLHLVAAHARSDVGRSCLLDAVSRAELLDSAESAGHLTNALHEFVEEHEALTLTALDEAVPLVADEAPSSEPRDLLALLRFARQIAHVRRKLRGWKDDSLRSLADRLPDTERLVADVAPRLGRDGNVADDASPELVRLRREMARVRAEVLAALDVCRRSHPDAVTDAPPTLRRDRYCLPVRSSSRTQIQGILLDVSARGATAFVEPLAVVELNNRLAETMVREQREVHRILNEVARQFAAVREDLAVAADVLAEIDAIQAKVLFGRRVSGTVVVPGDDDELVLRAARHPLLDESLHALRVELFGDSERRDPGHRVVPLDFRLPEGIQTLVVSGPNAGGKTVVLKTIGLMVLMCAHGIPLPVAPGTTMPRLRKLWCHVGDEQDVAADLSTFSAAMAATAALLSTADSSTLVLFDELGAGTDPLEGAALGCALLEELAGCGATTVATTHLANISLAASASSMMENAAMEYDEASERPLFTLRVGRPGRSRALEIARRMGVPAALLSRARELLGGDHLKLDRWLSRLEALEVELEEERSELALRRAEADGARQEAERALARLESERRRIPQELAAEREELRRRAKDKLDTAVKRLQQAIEEQEALGRRRLQKLREEALQLELPRFPTVESAATDLREGAAVRLALGARGVLREVRGSRAQVEVEDKRIWVSVAELEIVDAPPPAKRARVRVETGDLQDRELKLIGLDSERARDDLERFLDQASAAGVRTVRVVHGHGTGVLRRMTAEVCSVHPAVRSFRHPPQNRGGTGVTEVELETGE